MAGGDRSDKSWVVIAMLIPVLLWMLFLMQAVSELRVKLTTGQIQVQCK